MDWSYIAGYGDGEACLLLYISKDRREEKTKGSLITGWNIAPMWSLTTYDKTTLLAIANFLNKNNIRVGEMYLRKKRKLQLDSALRLTIYGWDNLKLFLDRVYPLSFAKKEQYKIFMDELYPLKHTLPLSKNNRRVWTKEKFLEAMSIIDRINSLKCRKRGKLNAGYFRELWNM